MIFEYQPALLNSILPFANIIFFWVKRKFLQTSFDCQVDYSFRSCCSSVKNLTTEYNPFGNYGTVTF